MAEKGGVAAPRPGRPAGSVQGCLLAAVAFWSVLVGGYSITIAHIYSLRSLDCKDVDFMVLMFTIAFIIAFVDFALVCAITSRKKKLLRHIMRTAMVFYMICSALSVFILTLPTADIYSGTTFWEIVRLAIYLIHLHLMYRSLAEMGRSSKGGDDMPYDADGGWLRSNLERQHIAAPTEAELCAGVHRPDSLAAKCYISLAPVH